MVLGGPTIFSRGPVPWPLINQAGGPHSSSAGERGEESGMTCVAVSRLTF